MDEPVMSGIPAHNRNIEGICEDDGEVLRIKSREISCIKHSLSPVP